MKTFSELLTDYMARTGTSDSELARTLGVRRQTIFRWKEGLTERPRHREDVLLCAKKLRLTDDERDELLLAAGFAPETPPTLGLPEPTQPSAPIVPVEPTPVVMPTPEPATVVIPSPSPRRIPMRAWIALGVTILLIAGIIIVLFALRPQGDYPIALPGEQLVIIAPFDPSPQISATPDMPSRRLPGDTSQFMPNDLASRVEVALEREVRAVRLDNVRVIRWRDQIRDANSAEAFRQRTNASVVIWGNAIDAKYSIGLALAPRVEEMPLDALLAAPTGAPFGMIDMSPDEIQALALLTVSQLYLVQGDATMARALLTQALERPLQDGRATATLNLYTGYTVQIAKPPMLGDAIQFYSQTLVLAPENTAAYLNRGVAYVRLNDAALWQADFARVQTINPDHFGARLAQCWAFALDQKPDLALPHCDTVVSHDSSARSREPRAIVYAEQGRLKEAATDLSLFVDWLGRQSPGLRARYGSSRADWVQAWQAGTNPIDASVLNKLRQE